MKNVWYRLLTLSLTAALAAFGLCQHPGDLIVTPTRILLDDRSHAGDITLVNRGTQPVRYRLTLIDMEMSDDGILRKVPASETSATGILRLSPREVLLEPGDSQRIKIAAFFPAGSSDGELRSHLAFEPIAIPKIANQNNAVGESLSLNFELRSVVTIPVIARHGYLTAAASISEASLDHDSTGQLVKFKLGRTGNRSIRGDVVVSFLPASGGPKVPLGQIVALPVYFPNSGRTVTVRLTRDISSLGKGEIEIRFAEPERSRGAATARSVVQLAK